MAGSTPSPGEDPRIAAILLELLKLPPEHRAPHLDEACGGDETLRIKVAARLAAHNGPSAPTPPSDREKAAPHHTESWEDGANRPAGELSLEADSTIGAFRIEREIGRGGMGIVYLAQDTQLGRQVAVKALPPELSGDRMFRERFEREARVLATLNHPSIATIHQIEAAGDRQYLILEYVPGDTLAERVARRPLKINEALEIALKIAEAVEAAHAKGVVHRDLKPGNIKITPDGRVKVLDFGLAKTVTAESGGLKAGDTLTEPGRITGTPAYMSPEAARGEEASHLCDIWSFGCVLYEMLTGRRPFASGTISDTLASILEHEPDWEVLPPAAPANIRVLIRRCLEKETSRRLHHMADARIEITETVSPPRELPPGTAPILPGAERSGWRRGLPWALAGLLVIVAGVAIGFALRGRGPTDLARQLAQPVISFSIRPAPEQELALNWNTSTVALSPDGRLLVYVAKEKDPHQLFLRHLDDVEARAIPSSTGARFPFFSPDGRWIAFFADRKLKKLELASGEVRELCEFPHDVSMGGCWFDDAIFFTPSPFEGLAQVSAAGGTPEILTTPDPEKDEVAHLYPQVLPGGREILFVISPTGWVRGEARIAVFSRGTKAIRTLDVRGSIPHYVATGHLVFARDEKLLAAPFDLGTCRLTGSPLPVRGDVKTTPAAQFCVSAGGALAYVPSRVGEANHSLAWVDLEGKPSPMPFPRGPYAHPRLSPDGTSLAVQFYQETGDYDLYICDLPSGTSRKFTFSPGVDLCPTWMPRSGKLTYSASRKLAHPDLYLAAPDGTDGTAQRLLDSDTNYGRAPGSWSPDERYLVFTETAKETGTDIWILEREGDGLARPFLNEPFNETAPVIHPQGGWLAYASDEDSAPEFEIYVQRFPEGGGKKKLSTQGGAQPAWDPAGDKLYYRNQNDMMTVAIETTPEFKASPPRRIFVGHYVSAGQRANYDISPDGKRFIMVIPAEEEPLPMQITVVLNWGQVLQRLAGTVRRNSK